ncbi:MAG: DUF4351 domain-containing protein [Bryobacteraceae bacterium]
MAQRYDVTAKLLLGRPRSVVFPRLFGGDVKHWHNVELPQVENKRSDMVPETVNGEIGYLEIDSQNERDLPRRMCGNYMEMEDRFPNNVVNPVLLYIGCDPVRHKTPYEKNRLKFDYDLIDAHGFSGAELLAAPDLEDNMLALLASDADRERVISVVLEKLAAIQGRQREDMALMFVILGGLRKVEQEIIERAKTMVTMADLMANKVLGPVLQDRLDEGERRGVERGRAEGRAEGLQTGRKTGECTLLIAQMERRFGALSPAAKQRIEQASEEQLMRWGIDLLTARSLEELLGN